MVKNVIFVLHISVRQIKSNFNFILSRKMLRFVALAFKDLMLNVKIEKFVFSLILEVFELNVFSE